MGSPYHPYPPAAGPPPLCWPPAQSEALPGYATPGFVVHSRLEPKVEGCVSDGCSAAPNAGGPWGLHIPTKFVQLGGSWHVQPLSAVR